MSSFDDLPPPSFDQFLDLRPCRELLQSFQAVCGWPVRLQDPDGKTRIASEEQWESNQESPLHDWFARNRQTLEEAVAPSVDILPSIASRQKDRLESGDEYVLFAYEDGLHEVGCPIVVGENPIATAVCGPFFFDAPDEAVLRRQATEAGLDPEAFLAVARSLPVCSREEMERIVRFCTTLLKPFLVSQFQEARRRDFETRWDALFQNMNSGFARMRILRDEKGVPYDYRIVTINVAFERLVGMDREELLGKTFMEVVPDPEKTWMDRFHRIATHGQHEMFVDYSPAFARFYAADAFCPTQDEMICFVTDVTEIRALRKLLTRREQLFQAVFGCAPMAIEIYDHEGNLIDANPAFFKTFGIRGAFEKVLDVNLFEDPNFTVDELERIRCGEILEIERQFDFDLVKNSLAFPTTASGKRWLGGVYSPLILEDSGEIEGYLGMVQDIEKRKEAEMSLRESEERQRAVLDAIPDLILHLEADGRCLEVHVAKENAGQGHLLLEKGEQEATKEIRRRCDQAITQALTESTIQVYNHSFTNANREVHEEVRVVPLPDQTVLVIVRDITDRIEMQEALRYSDASLRRSNERLGQIIRENGSIMIVLSPDYEIREFNTTAEKVFKRKRADVIGKDYLKLFVRSEDFESILEQSKRVLAGDPLIGREQEMLDSEGKPLRILWNVVPSRNNEGEVDGIIGSGFDVSEQRRLETELQEAQKMEAVGQLAAGVAHDFNNLLHAILGYAEMLERTKSLEKAMECAKVISEAGRRGSSLVRHLLLFSRKEPFNPELLEPNTVIMNVLSIAKSAVGENVDLLYQPDRKPNRIYADAGQIEQVIMNLCINAQHAIGADSGNVRIAVTQRTLDETAAGKLRDLSTGRYVVISVEDNGCGIPEEIRERIFEPFFTTKEVGQGTGLGLASAYAIAKRHQGSLIVESEVGRGSTFQLWLPMYDAKSNATAETTTDSDLIQIHARKLQGKVILLAEDEELALRLTESTLEAAGCRVLLAKDGVEAIEQFDAHRDEIDVVILDLVMPRKSGKEVYEAVTRLRPNVPIVFCSGYSQNVVTADFLSEIEADILQKPFPFEVLLERLEKALEIEKNG